MVNPQSTGSGRYILHDAIASGGMATVHIARVVGPPGYNRIVAAKRLHPELAQDPEFLTMFRDEARIASRIRHPNVVPVLDVAIAGSDVVLVQEYVHGVALDRLLEAAEQRGQSVHPSIAAAIAVAVARGLHAAHEARDERGDPLHVVHRDVSPHNVLVGADGTPRLVDFGVAKASLSAHVTRLGMFKGKLGYSAPEQLRGAPAARALDVYAIGVVLWELLVGQPLHAGYAETEIVLRTVGGKLREPMAALANLRRAIPADQSAKIVALTPIVMRALATAPGDRFATAAKLAAAIAAAVKPASPSALSRWVRDLGADVLAERARLVAAAEGSPGVPASSSGARWERLLPSKPGELTPLESAIPLESVTPVEKPAVVRREARAGRAWLPLVAGLTIGIGTAVGSWSLVAHRTQAGTTTRPPATQTAAVLTPPPPTADQASIPLDRLPPVPPAVPETPPPQQRTADSEAVSPAKPASASKKTHRAPAPQASAPPGEPSDAPAAMPAAPAAEASENDICKPPFYFEGDKKIFKPECF